MHIISPKLDFSFKKLLANEKVRRYLVSDILDIPVERIKSVRLLNTFLQRRYRKQKLGILDILVELDDGTKINFEMQVKIYDHWDRRSLFYLAKMYVEELRTGENYEKLKRCVHVSILDFNLTDSEKYHTIYRMRDDEGREFSNLLEVHVIELNKKLSGKDPIDNWIAFFNAQSEEELDMLSEKSLGLKEAVRELKEMSLTRQMRLLWEERQKEIRDANARESYVRKQGYEDGLERGMKDGLERGRKDGLERGRKDGLEQGRQQMLMQFLNHGGTEEEAEKQLGATKEEILEAKKRVPPD